MKEAIDKLESILVQAFDQTIQSPNDQEIIVEIVQDTEKTEQGRKCHQKQSQANTSQKSKFANGRRQKKCDTDSRSSMEPEAR